MEERERERERRVCCLFVGLTLVSVDVVGLCLVDNAVFEYTSVQWQNKRVKPRPRQQRAEVIGPFRLSVDLFGCSIYLPSDLT